MTTENTDSEDFYCGCSDDEKYNPAQIPDPTVWEPSPSQIIELYEKVASGDTLQLEWKCPGRRDPSPEAVKSEKMEVQETENVPNENEEKPVTEFDFDDMGFDSHPVTTPRRTPGASRTPRSVQKRVARLDKILDDITRHKKLNRAKAATQKSPVTTPVARPPPTPTAAVEPTSDPNKATSTVASTPASTSTAKQTEDATESKPETEKSAEQKNEPMEEAASPPPPPPPLSPPPPPPPPPSLSTEPTNS